MKKLAIITVAVVFILLSASSVFAGNPGVGFTPTQCEYYTYGNFDSIYQAFLRISLIFSDPRYKGSFAVAAVLSVLCCTIGFWLQGLSGGRSGVLSYVVPLITGALIYGALIVPTGTITVYDTVYNEFAAVPGIPVGIVMAAGALNTIESTAVDIIDTSGLPTSYQTSAGGKGVEVLLHLFQGGLASGDRTFDMNVDSYISSCVYPALNGSGGGLSYQTVMQGTQDFVTDVFGAPAVQNPAIFVDWMVDGTGPLVPAPSCSDAYTMITTWMTTQSNIDNMINTTCSASGFSPSDPNQMTQCEQLISGYLQQLSGGNITLGYLGIMKQIYTAERLSDTAKNNGAIDTQSYYQGLNSITSEISLNEWIPVMKAVITAIAIGILPFLLVFVTTPLVFKALGAAAGLFVWLTVWGVTDCVVHQFIIDYATNFFSQISNMQMGYDAVMFLPNQATKVLGLFGNARMFGMGLSTVITGLLVKFGGAAMSMAAGQMSGSVQASAGDAAKKTMDPAGKEQQQDAMRNAMGDAPFHNQFSPAAQAIARANTRANEMGGGSRFSNMGAAFASGASQSVNSMVDGGGMEFLRQDQGNGMVVNYSKGSLTASMSRDSAGNMQLVSTGGLGAGVGSSEDVSNAYRHKQEDMQQHKNEFNQSTGMNWISTLAEASGTSSTQGLAKKWGVSTSAAHEVSKSLSDTAGIIGENSDTIKDEKGMAVDKRAFARAVVEAKAGTPFGSVAPVSVSVAGQGGYEANVTTKDGHTYTATAGVKKSQQVQQQVGESWRSTTARMASKEASESDQRTASELMTRSNTESSTRQATEADSHIQQIKDEESRDIKSATSAKQDWQTAMVNWYANTNPAYKGMSDEQKYTSAIADIHKMSVAGDKAGLNKLTSDFISAKHLGPDNVTPGGSPAANVSLNSSQGINDGKERLAQDSQVFASLGTMQKPHAPNQNEINNLKSEPTSYNINTSQRGRDEAELKGRDGMLSLGRHDAASTPFGALYAPTTTENFNAPPPPAPTGMEFFGGRVSSLLDGMNADNHHSNTLEQTVAESMNMKPWDGKIQSGSEPDSNTQYSFRNAGR